MSVELETYFTKLGKQNFVRIFYNFSPIMIKSKAGQTDYDFCGYLRSNICTLLRDKG